MLKNYFILTTTVAILFSIVFAKVTHSTIVSPTSLSTFVREIEVRWTTSGLSQAVIDADPGLDLKVKFMSGANNPTKIEGSTSRYLNKLGVTFATSTVMTANQYGWIGIVEGGFTEVMLEGEDYVVLEWTGKVTRVPSDKTKVILDIVFQESPGTVN